MASTTIIVFVILIAGFYIYTLNDIAKNVHTNYPEIVDIWNSVPNIRTLEKEFDSIATLVNQHNQYELYNGFLPQDKIILTKIKCTVPKNETILKEWWMRNTLLKYYCKSGQYRYLDNDACMNNNTPICAIIKSCVGQEYDNLYVASEYCYVTLRTDPLLKIQSHGQEKWNNETQKLERILKVVVALPNGTQIMANDSRVSVLSYDGNFYKYNFQVLSENEILFQYNNNSGYTPVYEEFVDPDCTHWGCRRTWIYEKRRCGIAMTWNWDNQIVNNSTVSYWMVRHSTYRNYWNHDFFELILDEMN